MRYREGVYGIMAIFGREEKYQRVSDYVMLTITISICLVGITASVFSVINGIMVFSLAVCVYIFWNKKSLENLREEAKKRELALDYDSAIEIWDTLEDIEEAARVRKLKIEQGAMKVDQTVVQGDQITKTEIKDSVLNRSNVGGGSSKIKELEKLAEMKDKGIIDDDEFKQMKKEILG